MVSGHFAENAAMFLLHNQIRHRIADVSSVNQVNTPNGCSSVKPAWCEHYSCELLHTNTPTNPGRLSHALLLHRSA